MATVLEHKAALGQCCLAAQRKGHTGKLVLVWDVSPDGRVENAGARAPEYATAEVAFCIADALSTWQFPAAEKATTLIVFPFKY